MIRRTWLAALAVLAMATATFPGPAWAETTADLTPPVIDTFFAPAAAVWQEPVEATTTLTYTWSAHDVAGSEPLTYDLRYGAQAQLASADTSWTVGASATPDESWTATVRTHDLPLCAQVRARDSLGNRSAWSEPRCTVADQAAPWVDTPGLKPVHDGLASVPVPFRYYGGDDDQVASYDVALRLTPPGAPQGSWTSPRAWQGVASTVVSGAARAGTELCFRVRARDRAGRLSDDSFPRCTTVPYDDRALQRHGDVDRVRRSHALGHTATQLRRGQSLTMREVRGRRIWVRVLGRLGDRCVRVTLGPRHSPGCWLTPLSRKVTWQEFHFRAGAHGRLVIRGPGRVDAVAVVR